MNTDFQKVFELILNAGVPQDDMPDLIVAISDMEFDSAACGNTNFEAIQARYERKGYTMPQLAFWNVRSSSTHEQFPVKADERGVVLISGFSPAILSTLIDCPTDLSPWGMIRKIIEDPEYSRVRVPGDGDGAAAAE
jgi:hypothetical protein